MDIPKAQEAVMEAATTIQQHNTAVDAQRRRWEPQPPLQAQPQPHGVEEEEESDDEQTPLLTDVTGTNRRLRHPPIPSLFPFVLPPPPLTAPPLTRSSASTTQTAPTPEDTIVIPTTSVDQHAWKKLSKASVAFLLACALTFVEPARVYLGPMSHYAALAVLFFHPCKSVGGMLEATVMGTLGMGFAVGICSLGALVTGWLGARNLYAALALVLVLIFLATFLLAYIRAKSTRQPIFTGTILAHTTIIAFLTKVSPQTVDTLQFTVQLRSDDIWSIVVPMCAGVLVSLLSNWLLWPISAASTLQANLSRALHSFDTLLTLFTGTFLLEEQQEEVGGRVRIEESMKRHRTHFVRLQQVNNEARLELLPRLLAGKARTFTEILESMNRLTQHVGGMKSSVLKQDDMLLQRRLSNANIGLLRDILLHLGPELKKLSHQCHDVIMQVDNIIQQRAPSRLLRPVTHYNACITAANHVHLLQQQLNGSLQSFTESQKQILQALFENEKFDGTPNDELFLVYYFVFCLMEFTKELRNGLLSSVKSAKRREAGRKPWGWFFCCFGWPELVEDEAAREEELRNAVPTVRVHRAATEVVNGTSPMESSRSRQSSQYFEFLQSQTNKAFHQYIKVSDDAPRTRTSTPDPTSTSTATTTASSPPLFTSAFFLRHRLRLWRFLSDIGNSFELKFAFKMALLVTSVASLAFIPETKQLFHSMNGTLLIISAVLTMTPTVGGSNLAGLYRILGTFAGAIYSYLAWTLFPYQPVGLMVLIGLYALPSFYVLLFSKYPQVAQVSLFTVTPILLAMYSNKDNPVWTLSIWEVTWMRGVMVSIGIATGLVVTWYIWPYEARVELRKGLSDLLINMGILYSRLVEVFNNNQNNTSAHHRPTLPTKITASTVHQFYYQNFDHLSTEDTLSYFLSFELKLHLALMRLQQLGPLTRLEPRLKGPFPVEVYSEMIARCQNILDKFVAMRVAIANNVSLDEQEAFLESEQDGVDVGIDTIPSSRTVAPKAPPKFAEDLILGIAPPPKTSTSKPPPSRGQPTPTPELEEPESLVDHPFPMHPELLPHRREMVGSVLLCFYIYAGSLILKQPLPTYLPPAREARKRLLQSIHNIITRTSSSKSISATAPHEKRRTLFHRKQRRQSVPEALIQSPERYINYYAYALSLEDVIEELERLGRLLKNLFGEMFADVIQYDPNVRAEVGTGLNGKGEDLVDFEEARDTVVYMDEQPPVSMSIPIHHHRNDQWGNRRLHEIESLASSSSLPVGRPQTMPNVLVVPRMSSTATHRQPSGLRNQVSVHLSPSITEELNPSNDSQWMV